MTRYRPSDVLDRKAALADWLVSEQAERFFDGFLTSARSTPHHKKIFPAGTAGRDIAAHEIQALSMGEAYLVTSDMMDVVEYASRSMDEPRLEKEWMPTPYGFAMFEQTRVVTDVRNHEMASNAITWHQTVEPLPYADMTVINEAGQPQPVAPGNRYPGVRISMWTDKDERHDDWLRLVHETAEGKRTGFDWDLSQAGDGSGMRWMGQREAEEVLRTAPPLSCCHSMFIPFNVVFTPMDNTEETLAKIHASSSNTSWLQWISAMWLLMGQTLTSVIGADIDRHTRKRMIRKSIQPRVSVIALRRKAGQSHEHPDGQLIQWHGKWLVRGHWRNQPYKDGSIRPIWINTFVKGNLDGPWINNKKIYVFKR